MKQLVELRIRASGRPGFRMELGYATSRAQLLELGRQRDLLRRLHDRGEHDVLDAVKAGRTTPAELERLTDQHGIADYRKHLKIEPSAPAVPVPSLDAHVTHWLGTLKKRGTGDVYRKALSNLRDFVQDGQRLGDGPWHRIPPHVIRDAKLEVAKRLSANTVRTTMGGWSAFFEWAIDRERSESAHAGRDAVLAVNPVREARDWDPIEVTRHRFLSWEEYERLIDVAPHAMRAQYATLTLMGLRIDELMALPPAHVHLPTHVHIGPFGDWVPKGYPRSKRGVRDIPVHRLLLPLLEQYAELYAGQETFFVHPGTGRPWLQRTFGNRMQKDIEAAGMVFGQWTRGEGEFTRKSNGVTAHTLRHTLASWLAQNDVQLLKIAAILGDTVETIILHYAHLVPRDLDQAINRIAADD